MWRPVKECYVCGSQNVELDESNEFGKCLNCGHNWSGANFWEEPLPTDSNREVR